MFTFIIGSKAGKNETDRLKLKESYRLLAIYFQDLIESIKHGNPRRWDHFIDSNFAYTTPLGSISKDGAVIDLSQKVSKDLKLIESKAMRFGYNHNNLMERLIEIASKRLAEHSIEPVELKKYEISAKLSPTRRTFIEESFGIIIL